MGMLTDPRNESLPVSNRWCQNANTNAMYGLSNSFTIKFDNRVKFCLVINILKYCFVTLQMFSFFYDGWRDMSLVVTYRRNVDRRNVPWRERERVPTRWNHEQHYEISSLEATTIQRLNQSKFLDKVQVKRRSFHTRKVKRFSRYLLVISTTNFPTMSFCSKRRFFYNHFR